MTWDNKKRKAELPRDWHKRRAQVLKRDYRQCQWTDENGMCRAPANQVDHITRGLDHSLENLQALCEFHHRKKTAAEAAASRVKRARPLEQHPGLL